MPMTCPVPGLVHFADLTPGDTFYLTDVLGQPGTTLYQKVDAKRATIVRHKNSKKLIHPEAEVLPSTGSTR